MQHCGIRTDKIYRHGYYRFYQPILDLISRGKRGSVLEIGIQGGESLSMWQRLLPRWKVFGFDIDCTPRRTPRCILIQGDQSKLADLWRMKKLVDQSDFPPVRLVVDDGSHNPEHQIITFSFIFKHLLAKGGTYIIEDTELSYWTKGSLYGYEAKYGVGMPLNVVHLFKDVVDVINGEFIDKRDLRAISAHLENCGIFSEALTDISTVTFAQNCIIIRKKLNAEKAFENRSYRHAGNVEAALIPAPSGQLLISPTAGFGTRVRTMATAMILAQKTGRLLAHCWDGGRTRCAFEHIKNIQEQPFEHFFLPVDSCPVFRRPLVFDALFTEWRYGHYRWHFQNYAQIRWKFRDVITHITPTTGSVIIEGPPPVSATSADRRQIFRDKFWVQPWCEDRLVHRDTLSNAVGISIRLGEFKACFPEARIPLPDIKKWVGSLDCPVVLFSCTPSAQAELRALLRHPVPLPWEEENLPPADKVFLQFATLSRCRKVVATDESAFGEVAAEFGDVPYEPLSEAIQVSVTSGSTTRDSKVQDSKFET